MLSWDSFSHNKLPWDIPPEALLIRVLHIRKIVNAFLHIKTSLCIISMDEIFYWVKFLPTYNWAMPNIWIYSLQTPMVNKIIHSHILLTINNTFCDFVAAIILICSPSYSLLFLHSGSGNSQWYPESLVVPRSSGLTSAAIPSLWDRGSWLVAGRSKTQVATWIVYRFLSWFGKYN